VKGRLGIFLAGALVIWGVVVGAACLFWSDQAEAILLCSIMALSLCLVPTVATLIWSFWGMGQNPDQQLLAALGGTGVRMFFVLGVGLLLSVSVHFLEQHKGLFWLFVGVFYLSTLTLEMGLLLRAQSVLQPTSEGNKATSLPE
jgi:hypothetical protein